VDNYVRYSPEAAKIFMEILSAKWRVAETLRRMHELEVLDRYLPEFAHLKCLVRYDQYHKYTVDEHIFFAIANLEEDILTQIPSAKQFTELLNSLNSDMLGLLRLATLLHDIGKGVNSRVGHSKIGEEMTDQILKRMNIFSETDAECVRFLVSKHLEMSIVAQQRDISDPKALSDFANLVQTTQRLNMLYLLSFADKRAVDPELWTDWTAVLFREVYVRTLKYLTEGQEESKMQLEEIQMEIKNWLKDQVDEKHIQRHFDTMPERQILTTPVEKIAEHIKFIDKLGDKTVIVTSFPSPKTHSEIAFCARDERGLFHKITGVLASENINILSAQINTREDGIIIDVLNVTDGEAPKEISDEKLKGVETLIESVLKGEVDVEQLISTSRASKDKEKFFPPKPIQRQLIIPPSVTISNDASDTCTVIDVKAQDRIGLLHAITHAMVHLNLDISLAKISTESYQAVDSFYVTDDKHQKIIDPAKLEEIRRTLEEALK
jgi:[protein-PII] uridylyltransferase